MPLSTDAVLALAPDASSAKAARGLLAPAQWPTLGASDAALWGECQGSGAKPYQTQVDLAGPAFRCTCPSRKFPCKHGLALMLLHAEQGGRFAAGPPPAWVSEWLASRTEKEKKREEKAAEQAAPASPADALAAAEKDAKREAQRWRRIEQAAAELQRWLCDLLDRGLSTLQAGRTADFETMAARLVDGQAPGLAQRVRDAAALVGTSPDWPQRLLREFGLLQLALEGISRRATLDAAQVADLRIAAGWPIDKAELAASAQPLADTWFVLGQAIEERDDRLTERRVWLHGAASGRRALLLDHAFGGRGFERVFVTGSLFEAPLLFYPGASPLRASVVAAGEMVAAAVPPPALAAQEWHAAAQRNAANPWAPLQPLLLPQLVVAARDDQLHALCDGREFALQLGSDERWGLLAAGGGHPLTLAAEWDGHVLQPLTAWRADEVGGAAWQRGWQ
jgi:SWIM zinc finger